MTYNTLSLIVVHLSEIVSIKKSRKKEKKIERQKLNCAQWHYLSSVLPCPCLNSVDGGSEPSFFPAFTLSAHFATNPASFSDFSPAFCLVIGYKFLLTRVSTNQTVATIPEVRFIWIQIRKKYQTDGEEEKYPEYSALVRQPLLVNRR